MKQSPASALVRLRDGWEIWELPGEALDQPPRLLGADRDSSAKNRILAMPARLVMAAPIWVDSTDPEVVKTSIALEWEVRGWLPRKKSMNAVCSRQTEAGGKTLVIGTIFPAGVLAPYAGKDFARYEASPFLVEPVEDAVALWREGDDLVAVFTRGREVVYWATLDWPSHSSPIRNWLEMLCLHLTASGVLESRPRRVVLDTALENHELTGLLPGVPQEISSFPPSLKNAGFAWKPESARETERKADSTRKTRRVVLALAAAYLVLALAAGLHLGWLALQSRFLQNQITQLAAATSEFQPVVREWRIIGPGAETGCFPLEVLHHVVRTMPPAGICLTIYDTAEGRVTIEGEAVSASLASQFFAAVTRDKDLRHMNWQMPTPALLPNSAARFQLTGVIP
ncbi:MAG: hypothetical protein WCQ57_02175 [Verrucomicrobiota bacterium]